MRVEPAGGDAFDFGTLEANPTISLTDYSKRVTDAFGVTTVVKRGFARRMAVRMALPFTSIDTVQRTLADLRATQATWIADDRFASLSVEGFYKEFALDLNVPPLAYCSLTIEGLAEADPGADPGTDPAPDGRPSTLQLLQPVEIAGGGLVSSSVAEADYAAWSSAGSYAEGARVIQGHRVWESLTAANTSDPAALDGQWLDIGPTNRWAMFDQALGTATVAANSIAVTLSAGSVNAVALLDVIAATVRVQSAGYDHTIEPVGGAVTFLDLPTTSGNVIVTIAGASQVTVGTLLIGRVVGLGTTEASPSAGITDYSRKETDDFGDVTLVERAWAKRMTTAALIRTEAIDVVMDRVAAVRAVPSLWIGQAGIDSLSIYGFFKDFSIEVGESVSKVALTVEGLSRAATPGVATDEGRRLVVIYRNAVDQPTAPATGGGPLPTGWTEAPEEPEGAESRWWSQAAFNGDVQLTDWTTPVAVAGIAAVGQQVRDIIDAIDATTKTDEELVSNGSLSPAEKAAIWDQVHFLYGGLLAGLTGLAQKLNINTEPAQDAFEALEATLTSLPNWSSDTLSSAVDPDDYLAARANFFTKRDALNAEIQRVQGGMQATDPIYDVAGGALLAGNRIKGVGTWYSIHGYTRGAHLKMLALSGTVAWGLVEDPDADGPEDIAWGYRFQAGTLTAIKDGVTLATKGTGLTPPVSGQVDYFDGGSYGDSAAVQFQSAPVGTLVPSQIAVAGKTYYAKAFLLSADAEMQFQAFVGEVVAPYSAIPGKKPPPNATNGANSVATVYAPDATPITTPTTFPAGPVTRFAAGSVRVGYLDGFGDVGDVIPADSPFEYVRVHYRRNGALTGTALLVYVWLDASGSQAGAPSSLDLLAPPAAEGDAQKTFARPDGAVSIRRFYNVNLTSGSGTSIDLGVPYCEDRAYAEIDNAVVIGQVAAATPIAENLFGNENLVLPNAARTGPQGVKVFATETYTGPATGSVTVIPAKWGASGHDGLRVTPPAGKAQARLLLPMVPIAQGQFLTLRIEGGVSGAVAYVRLHEWDEPSDGGTLSAAKTYLADVAVDAGTVVATRVNDVVDFEPGAVMQVSARPHGREKLRFAAFEIVAQGSCVVEASKIIVNRNWNNSGLFVDFSNPEVDWGPRHYPTDGRIAREIKTSATLGLPGAGTREWIVTTQGGGAEYGSTYIQQAALSEGQTFARQGSIAPTVSHPDGTWDTWRQPFMADLNPPRTTDLVDEEGVAQSDADVLNIYQVTLTSVPDIIVECTGIGTPLVGQLPVTRQLRYYLGSDDVTELVDWSVSVETGMDISISNSAGSKGLMTLNTLTAGQGYAQVSAVRGITPAIRRQIVARKSFGGSAVGETIEAIPCPVPAGTIVNDYQRFLDDGFSYAAGLVYAFSNRGVAGYTYAADGDDFLFHVGTDGKLAFDGAIQFSAQASGSGDEVDRLIAGKIQYSSSLEGIQNQFEGSWWDFDAETVAQTAANTGGTYGTLTFSNVVEGLDPGAPVYLRLALRAVAGVGSTGYRAISTRSDAAAWVIRAIRKKV